MTIDPDFFFEPVNLLEEYAKFARHMPSGWVRRVIIFRAAENRARALRAPEVLLDHMLLAVLQEGTATWSLLVDRGVDTALWVRRLEYELPLYVDGPDFPPDSLQLRENVFREDPALPYFETSEDQREEQIKASPWLRRRLEVQQYITEVNFSDLQCLRACAFDETTIGFSLLVESGLLREAKKLLDPRDP